MFYVIVLTACLLHLLKINHTETTTRGNKTTDAMTEITTISKQPEQQYHLKFSNGNTGCTTLTWFLI